MHPFEAFVLLGCVHRDASWCMSTSIALQSPKLSPSLGNVDAAACSVGLLGTSRQPTDTPSRMATVTDYRTDSTYALMVRESHSGVPADMSDKPCADRLMPRSAADTDISIHH